MGEKNLLERIKKRVLQTMQTPGSFSAFSFDQILAGCASVYTIGVRLRYALYRAGFFKTRLLGCPVISIGNLAVGGSGKTPMVIWLANMLVEKGVRPVVISRGYKGTLENEAAVVSDGRNLFLDAQTCGDEPYMIAMEKAFPVVVGKDRYKAGLMALETFSFDVVILDDGFQHLKLGRTLDLVLLDYRQPLGNKRMLPAGRLRETLDMAKGRIDAVVLTRSQLDALQEDAALCPAQEILQAVPSIPVFLCAHEPFVAQLFPAGSYDDKTDFKTWSLNGKTAVLFSGLALNASFAQSVQDLGVNIADHLEFYDHYRYKKPDFKRILARAKALDVDLILTTQKDWVKVNPACFRDITVAVIGLRLRFSDPQGFEKFILNNVFGQAAASGSSMIV